MKKILIKTIKNYQFFSRTLLRSNALPFLFQSQCRFYPSCSDYAIESLNKYGVASGLKKTLGRVMRCNPLSKPGVDIP